MRIDCTDQDLLKTVEAAKQRGERILSVSPSKILRGKVTEHIVLTHRKE